MRTLGIIAAVTLVSACSAPGRYSARAPATAQSPAVWPTPLVAAPADKPHILALWMNETTIADGSNWYGRAVTSTNVASLEIRTESFSFVADRTGYGEFRFSQHVLDMVPFYKRAYVLHVIARNAAGDQAERLVHITFR